jgi:hypothetical protein
LFYLINKLFFRPTPGLCLGLGGEAIKGENHEIKYLWGGKDMKSVSRVIGLLLAMNLIMSSAGISMAVAGINLQSQKGTASQLSREKKLDSVSQAKAAAAFAHLPMAFEINEGQTDKSVKFLSRGKGYSLFLTATEAVLALQAPAGTQDVVRMRLQGAKAGPLAQGLARLPSYTNYLTGHDPQKWHTGVAQYSQVALKQVYPGIDMIYHGNQKQLEYDFVVAPGANPGMIRLAFQGITGIKLDTRGNLVLGLKAGRQQAFSAPVLYQGAGNSRKPVTGRFVLAGPEQVGFSVGAYDKSQTLVIDPSLLYSTYLGGTVEDRVNAIALDNSGDVYLAGLTVSNNFPGSAGKYQSVNGGGTDAFVTKISAAGALLWSTYLGGSGIDIANALAVDGSGIVYLTGSTTSSNFPTAGPYQAALAGGTDAFVAAISAAGTGLVYSTYLGGAGVDSGNGIAVDAAGSAYVTGATTSSAFPVTAGAYQTVAGGASDAFVAKFNPAGGLAYSTFLGGTAADIGRGIAIDGVGNAYVCGQAADTFPIVPAASAFKTTITGPYDAFVSKLDSTGAILLYSTYVGGSDIDDAYALALDGANPATLKVYLTGYTFSADMPKPGSGFANVGQTTIGTAPDAYVFKLNMNGGGGNLDGVYFTYLGGSTDDRGTAIKVDGAGNAYVTGHTTSPDFPIVNPLLGQGVNGGTGNVFVSELGPTGATKVFSTYLGGVTDQAGNGIGLDSAGNIYVAGWTNSTGFPTAGSAPMPLFAANQGSYDGFLAKISAPSPLTQPLPAITSVNPAGGTQAGGTTVVITGTGFANITGSNGVMFGGNSATNYTVNSNTQITATAPAHASGIVNIVATSPLGSSAIVPADTYTYFITSGVAPLITGLNPTVGPTSGGTMVVINGTGFKNTAGPNGVKFGAFNAESYVVNSDTQITAVAPAHAVEIVNVVVTSLAGSSPQVSADCFTYFSTSGQDNAPFDPYIFPSPTQGSTAHIAYFMTVPGNAHIRVYSEIGKLVDTQEERKPAGPQSSSLNVGKLAPGVYLYLLNLDFDDGTTSKYKRKFAVTH